MKEVTLKSVGDLGENEDTIIPAEMVEIYEDKRAVTFEGISKENIADIPRFGGREVEKDYEEHVQDTIRKIIETGVHSEKYKPDEKYVGDRLFRRRRRRNAHLGWRIEPHSKI